MSIAPRHPARAARILVPLVAAISLAALSDSSPRPIAPRALPTPAAVAPPAPPATAGMVVAIDPETGALGMPTREQMLELSKADLEAVSKSSEGLVEVHHPDGSVSIDVRGRFQEFAIVHLDPDGKPVVQCLDDPAAIKRALRSRAPARKAEER